jgi:hypothetical protein
MRRLIAIAVAAAGLAVVVLGGDVVRSAPAAAQVEYRSIAFPVREDVYYADTFGACRDGCSRRHQGQDLMGKKMNHLLAATDATVAFMRTDAAGTGGNWLVLRDRDGWSYNYGHINNDTPGTDDGSNLFRHMYASGMKVGATVQRGQFVAYMGDSGNAENSGAHVHFEIRDPDGVPINPWASLRLAQGKSVDGICGPNTAPDRDPVDGSVPGYWTVSATGKVKAFGTAEHFGDRSGSGVSAPVVAIAATPTRAGYWLATSDGGVYRYGDAHFRGDARAMALATAVVDLAPTPSGHGYWLATEDGAVLAFGDARSYGSLANRNPNAAVVAISPSRTGAGYRLVTATGGVSAFGDAALYGSAAGSNLVSPIIGLTETPSGAGYWLFSRRGGLLAYGDAARYGAVPELGLCDPAPAVDLLASASGAGYLIAQADGAMLAFGDAESLGGTGAAIVDAAPAG